jgi:translation initiation factor IF-3
MIILESTFSKTIIMEVTGKIKVVNPEQQVSASFRKRELVVATEEQYPQFISINFVQDKCDLLNNYNVGEAVKVSINLRGREWTNPQGEVKYFNTLESWRIESIANSTQELKKEDIAHDEFNPSDVQDLPF